MNTGHCLACGEPLVGWARVDRKTCGYACRSRLYRTRKAARLAASATPTAAATPRSAPRWTNGPPRPGSGRCPGHPTLTAGTMPAAREVPR